MQSPADYDGCMNPCIRIAALAAAALLSLPLGAADDPSLDQLAARASELVTANRLDEAEPLVDQALEKNKDFAPALVQKARIVLARGNESRESLGTANRILWRAVESDQRYAPPTILMIHIQEKAGWQTFDPRQWFYRSTKQRANDEPWLVPYQLEYAMKYEPQEVSKYQARLVQTGQADHKTTFEVHLGAMKVALRDGERAKADGEMTALLKMEPGNAFIPGDYSRDVMIYFLDFDGGERYARQALAMKDYPHARQSLSLALYGKWAMAKRTGAGPAEVKALLQKAQANDPGARNVPECAVEYGPLTFVATALDGLEASRRKDPTLRNC